MKLSILHDIRANTQEAVEKVSKMEDKSKLESIYTYAQSLAAVGAATVIGFTSFSDMVSTDTLLHASTIGLSALAIGSAVVGFNQMWEKSRGQAIKMENKIRASLNDDISIVNIQGQKTTITRENLYNQLQSGEFYQKNNGVLIDNTEATPKSIKEFLLQSAHIDASDTEKTKGLDAYEKTITKVLESENKNQVINKIKKIKTEVNVGSKMQFN